MKKTKKAAIISSSIAIPCMTLVPLVSTGCFGGEPPYEGIPYLSYFDYITQEGYNTFKLTGNGLNKLSEEEIKEKLIIKDADYLGEEKEEAEHYFVENISQKEIKIRLGSWRYSSHTIYNVYFEGNQIGKLFYLYSRGEIETKINSIGKITLTDKNNNTSTLTGECNSNNDFNIYVNNNTSKSLKIDLSQYTDEILGKNFLQNDSYRDRTVPYFVVEQFNKWTNKIVQLKTLFSNNFDYVVNNWRTKWPEISKLLDRKEASRLETMVRKVYNYIGKGNELSALLEEMTEINKNFNINYASNYETSEIYKKLVTLCDRYDETIYNFCRWFIKNYGGDEYYSNLINYINENFDYDFRILNKIMDAVNPQISYGNLTDLFTYLEKSLRLREGRINVLTVAQVYFEGKSNYNPTTLSIYRPEQKETKTIIYLLTDGNDKYILKINLNIIPK